MSFDNNNIELYVANFRTQLSSEMETRGVIVLYTKLFENQHIIITVHYIIVCSAVHLQVSKHNTHG